MSIHDQHKCSHPFIKQCAPCDVAYCSNCTKVWGQSYPYYQFTNAVGSSTSNITLTNSGTSSAGGPGTLSGHNHG